MKLFTRCGALIIALFIFVITVLFIADYKNHTFEHENRCYIVEDSVDFDAAINHQYINKNTEILFVESIIVFIAMQTKVFIDNLYLKKENLTSHFNMKHRMQNPRCKLY